MMPDITFIGWHNAGKTTILCAVIKELSRRGRKVAVVKHTKHTLLDMNASGTDSALLLKAGAKRVTVMTPKGMVHLERDTVDSGTGATMGGCEVFDVVLGEGFKYDPAIPKIEVARKGVSNEGALKGMVTGVIAVVTDNPEIEETRDVKVFE
ncbi:MAG: molybdopterin-guanine dinucleotide biosynthesis protein B, partial [Dissulfurimicrobium sp.]